MLRISLDRTSYSPGDTITARIEVSLEKEVKARGLFARLRCEQRLMEKMTKVMDQYDLDRAAELGVPYSGSVKTREEEHDSIIFDQEKKVSGDGTYSKGFFVVRFTLPMDAAPTSGEFGHDNRINEWHLSAKLDIPLATDISDEVKVFVGGL